MQVTREEIEPCTVSLTISVDADAVDRGYARAYREFAAVTNVPGFRPGKAPRAVLERYLDKSRVDERVAEVVASQAYRDALRQEQLQAYDDPEVEFDELKPGAPWQFKAVVSLPPRVELGDLEGVRVERPVYTPTDEDVDREIDRIRENAARMETVEGRPVQAGDWVIGDLAIQVEGLDEPAEPRRSLIRLGGNIPGFDEAIIGQNIGEERVFTLTYPEDYQEADRAGKQATFTLTVTSIREKRLPEVNDEWARQVSDSGTVQELRDAVRSVLQSRADDLSEDVVQARIVQALLDRSKIEYPVLLLKRQAAADLKDLEQRLQDAGVTYQQFLEAEGLTEEQHRERVAEAADRRVKTRLLLQELARVKELGVSEQEIDGEFQRLFADADPADKSVRRITQSDQQREHVANLVIQRKLRDCLKSIATIVDAPATPAE